MFSQLIVGPRGSGMDHANRLNANVLVQSYLFPFHADMMSLVFTKENKTY